MAPNLIDELHNGTVQDGSTWLSHAWPAVLSSAATMTRAVSL
jgi:hypothetical protein